MSRKMDIAVVGGGAAGIAAAITAGRAGCRTLLLDRNSAIGGTGGCSGLTTLCGLYDDSGHYLNEGFSREFAEALAEAAPLQMGKVWVLPYRPEKFREVAARLFNSTPNLEVRSSAILADVVVESNRIVGLNGVDVGAVIDCTGTAEVARAIGVECLATDETTQASAVIFPLRNIARPIQTAADAVRVLLPLARAGLPPLNFQPNVEPGTVTVKFTGKPEQAPEVIKFLRDHVSGFKNCETPLKTFTAAHRAGRMIVGQYMLTGSDVLAGRKFDDAVTRCAWPVEQWDSSGVARFKYLPAGTHYEIPARSLRSGAIGNLFMAGKTISADVEAIASARVIGCCLATGAAAGNLAARDLQLTGTT